MSSHLMQHLICWPVLLKITHLVLSEFTFKPLSDENFTKSRSILVSPSLLSDIITKSSAQSMLLSFVLLPIIAGSFSSLSRIPGKSDMKILNNMGLNMQPCHTP